VTGIECQSVPTSCMLYSYQADYAIQQELKLKASHFPIFTWIPQAWTDPRCLPVYNLTTNNSLGSTVPPLTSQEVHNILWKDPRC